MIRRLPAAIAAAAVSAVLLTSCTSGPTSGRIVDTDFDRGRCTTKVVTTKTGNTTTATPKTNCTKDRYRLKLDDGRNTGWRNVSPGEYDRARIGDTWPK